MEANWSFKPAVTAVDVSQTRLLGTSPAVAPTVLPAQNTVRAAAESASPDDDFGRDDKATKGEIILDHSSHQVIYRVRDEASRRVIWQVPDAATLRLRAYARASDPNADQVDTPKADIEA
jgi:hypothetical protein